MSTTKTLRPWADFVKLHPDVESDALTAATFAIDLGAIAAGEKDVPAVYRDAEAFFRATYLTAELRRLLEEVLTSLTGKGNYDRVVKLRTPFGGGKSHTLAALFHAAKNRKALNAIPEGKGLPDPGNVAVAVFDGEKFDARNGKEVDGKKIQTMWGWLAWQIDPKNAFPLVEGHDRDRIAPGGDVIREVLTKGAGGKPVLLLLDELLKYIERAGAVAVLDSTLRRQALDFFQNLTVEVAGTSNTALLYSLQWSDAEALGHIALLREIDKIASRVDQLREPVTGDEVLPILQRRLIVRGKEDTAIEEVASAYADVATGMRRSYAETASEKSQAEEFGLELRNRICAAYPFHPALIDLMKERWTSVDAFQRTRGSLRFLASCLYSLKQNGGSRALLGPGEIPIKDPSVRIKMLKELGVQNDYDPVITADIDGPNARARKIDERMAKETPAMGNVKPATRLATAILLYSFGGLKRDAQGSAEALPPGVRESELLASCVGPDLDTVTATAVLSELRNSCLYLHHDGVRYCFKKDPNVTKLIEDAEQEVSREESRSKGSGPVKEKIKEVLEGKLAGRYACNVWPEKSQDIPDEEPRFLVAYMPLEFAAESAAGQEKEAKQFLSKYGDKPRRYRNGLGLAIPDKKHIESLRRAVRYLLGIERVESRKQQHRLSKDQLDQLKERRRTEEAAAESGLRELYSAVWLPRVESGDLVLEKVEKGGRPLQATGVHERVMELLTSQGTPKVHSTVTPAKIIERMKLGVAVASGESPRLGVRVAEIVEAFYRDIEPPRLDSAEVFRRAIVKGIVEKKLGYTTGYAPGLGLDGKFQIGRDKVSFYQATREDEIDLTSGFIMLPSAVPDATADAPTPQAPQGIQEPSAQPFAAPVVAPAQTQGQKGYTPLKKAVQLEFFATREQVFKTFAAIANLADKSDSGKVVIRVEAYSEKGYDQSWLRNAVEEPLDEANVERKSPPQQ